MARALNCYIILLVSANSIAQNYGLISYDLQNHSSDRFSEVLAKDSILYGVYNGRCLEETVDCSGIVRINTQGSLIDYEILDWIDKDGQGLIIENDSIILVGYDYATEEFINLYIQTIDGDSLARYVYDDSEDQYYLNTKGLAKFEGKYIIAANGINKDNGSSGENAILFWLNGDFTLDTVMIIDLGGVLDWSRKLFVDKLNRQLIVSYDYAEMNEKNMRLDFRGYVRIDTSRSIVDQWFYGPDHRVHNMLLESELLRDGSYIFTSVTSDIRPEPSVWNVSRTGELLWQYDFTFAGNIVRSIHNYYETKKGTILGCGSYSELPNIITTGWIFELSKTGELIWEKYYVDYYDNSILSKDMIFYDLTQINGNDIVAVGRISNSYEEQSGNIRVDNDAVFLKVDSNGCITRNCNVGQNVATAYPLLLTEARWVQVAVDSVVYSITYRLQDIGQQMYELLAKRDGIDDEYLSTNMILHETSEGKVYLQQEGSPVLLYDFGLQEGEAFTSDLLTDSLIVYDVDSIMLLDGSMRKRQIMICNNSKLGFRTEWIEGIGDIGGFLGPLAFCGDIPPVDEVPGLTCYFLGNELLYHNDALKEIYPNLEECFIISSLKGSKECGSLCGVRIGPNPVRDIVCILDSDHVVKECVVYDELGNFLMSVNASTIERISLEGLCPGIYYIKMITHDGNNMITRIIKM